MIILDTHSWIWLVSDPEKLSKKALLSIKSEKTCGLSAISCWEFCTLVQKGRISIDRSPLEWMEQSLKTHKIELIPLTPAISFYSTQLGEDFHGDPADRIIAATTSVFGARLITKDEKLRKSKRVLTIW